MAHDHAQQTAISPFRWDGKVKKHSPALSHQPGVPVVASAAAQPVRQIQIKGANAGIWTVACDGSFHGHFEGYRAAMDAAKACAEAIVASGGAADVGFDPNGERRTIEFRAGSRSVIR